MTNPAGLRRDLTQSDVTMIAIGSTIGTGILFVLPGIPVCSLRKKRTAPPHAESINI